MDTRNNPTKLMLSLFFLCLHLNTSVTLAGDSITTSQSLSGDQTIVSAGGKFELGFFKPGDVTRFFKHISQQIIVWVANKEQPVFDIFSSELRISDGNLVLFDESNTPIWYTNVSSSNTTLATSIRAVLLDDGNLVLRPESGSSKPLWQSFDHPAHTWLPGSRIGVNRDTNETQMLTSWKNSEDPSPGQFSLELDPTSYSYILKWNRSNRSEQYWTSGTWNENKHGFSLIPEMRDNHIYNLSYATNENESYCIYFLYDPSITTRLIIHASGQVQQLSWLEDSKQWNLFWSQPKQCQVYGLCGPFSSCDENSLPLCNCLMGYEPKSLTNWKLGEYSVGCSRRTRLQCGNATGVDGMTDRFIETSSMLSSGDEHFLKSLVLKTVN